MAPDFHKQTNNNNHDNNQHNNNYDIIQNNNNSKDCHQTTTKMNKKMKTESSLEPDSRLLYCPLASETLSYIQSMADHPNITVFTNTSYEGLVNVNKKKRDDNDDDNNGQQQQHSAKLCSTTIDSNPNNTNTMNSTKNIFGGGGGIITTQKEEKKKKRVVKQVVSAQTIILAVGYTTHNSGKPWMPIDRTAVTNGATIIHSAELSGSAALLPFNNNNNNNNNNNDTTTITTTSSNNNHNHQQNSNAIGTTYVVGGQKAAIEVLKSMNPSTENNKNNNVVWALRRHGIFLKREVIDEALAVTTTNTDTDDAPTISWIMSRIVRLVPTLIYFGKFQMAESILMALGMGVRVGENANVDADANANEVPSFRGGIVRQEDIDHALKFKQTIITNVGINSKGAVVLKRNRNNNGDDGGNDESSDMVVGPNDRIIFCTGQRTGQSTDDYMNMAVDHSKDGLFVALPYSSQACSAAAYTTKLVLDYLDGNSNSNSNSNGGGGDSLSNSKSTSNSTSSENYSSGKFKASLEKLASHVRQVPSGGSGNSNNEWAKVVVMLSGVGLQFPNQILPSVRGDLAMSPHWTSSKVLGQNLDARATLKEFAKPDYGGLYTMATVGVTLLGFRFAKRRFLELPTFKK